MSKPADADPFEDLNRDELRDRLSRLIDKLSEGLVERDLEVRLAILAMLSGEHILLIGPPGTAKSEIARRLVRAVGGAEIFERLLTRFSVPEDIFGPLSLKALEEDRYERKTEGYLPTASVAFIDEIFKANSAILNALLTLLNERKFDQGNTQVDAPLVAMVGASNELPQEEELQALYDRFLVRCHVTPITDDGFRTLLRTETESAPEIDGFTQLGPIELEEIETRAQLVQLPDDVLDTLSALREHLASRDIYVSDRRWKKAVKLLKTAAFTNGQEQVTFWECWLLQHCLWNEPDERKVIWEWYESRVGAENGDNPTRFVQVVNGLERILDKERGSKSQALDEKGRHLFRTPDGKKTAEPDKEYQERNEEGELLFLSPVQGERKQGKAYTRTQLRVEFGDDYNRGMIRAHGCMRKLDSYCDDEENKVLTSPSPAMEPTRYSQAHIDGRINQTQEMIDQVTSHIKSLDQEIKVLSDRIAHHLWIDTDFAEVALNNLKSARSNSIDIKARLEEVRDGFAKLPVTEDDLEV